MEWRAAIVASSLRHVESARVLPEKQRIFFCDL
jgi:hypothetical protein